MNRKTVSYVCLALALAGFIVDRLFFAAPAEAEADPPAAVQRNVTSPNRSRTNAGEQPTPGKNADALLWHLDQLEAPTEETRNVFMASPTMLAHYQEIEKQEQEHAEQAVIAADELRQKFISSHQLQATVINGPTPLAYVDDQVLVVGDVLDGHTLTHIGPKGVVFQKEDLIIVLRLPVHWGTKSARPASAPAAAESHEEPVDQESRAADEVHADDDG